MEQCQLLYSLEDDVEEQSNEKMKTDVKPNGEKVFNFATGISILIFMLLLCSVSLPLQ